jgi:hypothetical protein
VVEISERGCEKNERTQRLKKRKEEGKEKCKILIPGS